jgi:hypothetical protein
VPDTAIEDLSQYAFASAVRRDVNDVDMTETTTDYALDQRAGWPPELRVLLERYPRETWSQSASPLAQFWLDKHDAFRRYGQMLVAAADDYREGRTAPAELAAWSVPRLQGFLGGLHGHHQIEDFHYFPAFRAAESRLAAGFDVLANDHELLHRGIVDVVETVNAFVAAIREGPSEHADAQRETADRYARSCELLYRRLCRHLDDEEDLIIPVMLDRGE